MAAAIGEDAEVAKDAEREGRIKRKKFENELLKLQARLCVLQDYVKEKGLRVIIVFEG
jgi:polyphosphate kinase